MPFRILFINFNQYLACPLIKEIIVLAGKVTIVPSGCCQEIAFFNTPEVTYPSLESLYLYRLQISTNPVIHLQLNLF